MKFKSILLIFLFLFITTNSQAIPRCEELYNGIYNDVLRKDVNILTVENHKTIGIELEKFWNPDKELKWVNKNGEEITVNVPGWSLKTNKDGYYSVGKITKRLLVNLDKNIEIGDIILNINERDIRGLVEEGYGDKDELLFDVSNLFEENELIKFKLKRKDSSEIYYPAAQLPNERMSFNRPHIDFYINSLEINEKTGNFKASIETNFREKLDKRYFLTEAIWKYIVYDKEFVDDKLKAFMFEICTYPEDRWQKLNSVDPAFGIVFDNLIKEDKQTKNSSYVLEHRISYLDYENNGGGYLQDKADIYYKSTGSYTFKNDFNLRAFPFDKQKINLSIYNSFFGIENFRPIISHKTISRALDFKNQNKIEGWNIVNVKTSHGIDDDPTKFTKHDKITISLEIERKSGYYIFKIIFPIVLILIICWSSIWINPKEIESRLTITIVCLLSLIAYNFVIDSDLPKLEYLTIMDFIILISYVYAAIPNFLSIYSYKLINTKNKVLASKYEDYEKRFGLPSYLLVIFLIVIINSSKNADHSISALAWFS